MKHGSGSAGLDEQIPSVEGKVVHYCLQNCPPHPPQGNIGVTIVTADKARGRYANALTSLIFHNSRFHLPDIPFESLLLILNSNP